jgi:hypothetical protein
MRSARSLWTRSKGRNRAIPACRWGWPTSPRCCSRGCCASTRKRRMAGSRPLRRVERPRLNPALRPVAFARLPGDDAEFGDAVVDQRTYVFCGDGCLMEGISHETVSLAGHLRLAKLTALYDDNAISIDGPTTLAVSDNQLERFRACGWRAERIDGRDTDVIAAAITRSRAAGRASSPAGRSSPLAHRPRPAPRRRTARHSAPPRSPERANGSAGTIRLSSSPRMSAPPGWRPEGGAGRRDAPGKKDWRRCRRSARRIRATAKERAAGRSRCRDRRALRRFPQERVKTREAPGLRHRARPFDRNRAGAAWRLGRSDRVEQRQGQEPNGALPGRFHRPLSALWGARTRHGGGDERHRRAWRPDPLWRDLSRVFRLLPPLDPAVGILATRRRPRHDPRFDRARRGRADASARRASGGIAGDARALPLSAGRCGRDCRMLGARLAAPGCAVGVGFDPPKRCRCCAATRRPTIGRGRAPMCWPKPKVDGRSPWSPRAPKSRSRWPPAIF